MCKLCEVELSNFLGVAARASWHGWVCTKTRVYIECPLEIACKGHIRIHDERTEQWLHMCSKHAYSLRSNSPFFLYMPQTARCPNSMKWALLLAAWPLKSGYSTPRGGVKSRECSIEHWKATAWRCVSAYCVNASLYTSYILRVFGLC